MSLFQVLEFVSVNWIAQCEMRNSGEKPETFSVVWPFRDSHTFCSFVHKNRMDVANEPYGVRSTHNV